MDNPEQHESSVGLERKLKVEQHWWNAWTAPRVVIQLIIAVGILGYMIFFRIPDLEKRIELVREEHKERSITWEKQQNNRFDQIEGQFLKIRTTLFRLCIQREKQTDKGCKIEELVATISDLTTQQAQFVARAKIEGLVGRIPVIGSPTLQAQLASSAKFPEPTIITNKQEDIASLMAWSTAADEARWSMADGELKVRFSNGSAVFTPHASVSSMQLTHIVEGLNNASNVVKAAAATLGK